jgi:hypothetical protein
MAGRIPFPLIRQQAAIFFGQYLGMPQPNARVRA